MQNASIGQASSSERAQALFVALELIAAQSFYFLFYDPLAAQAVNFRGMNTLWLKIHIDLYWTSHFLLFASLVSTVLLILRHRTTRFPWVETSTLAAGAFSVLALVFGVLFAKSAWGAYWIWDAKNTFVLLFATPGLIAISFLTIGARVFLRPPARNLVLLLLLFVAVGLCAYSFMLDFRRVMHPQVLIQTLFPN